MKKRDGVGGAGAWVGVVARSGVLGVKKTASPGEVVGVAKVGPAASWNELVPWYSAAIPPASSSATQLLSAALQQYSVL